MSNLVEISEPLEKELFKREVVINNSAYNLDMAEKALWYLLEEYEFAESPDPAKALKYSRTVGTNKCTEAEKNSGKYIFEYSNIMFLIHVAHDYCHQALKECEKY